MMRKNQFYESETGVHRPSIALITLWSGPLPRYFSLFLKSVNQNQDITFIFLSDQSKPQDLPSNMQWIERSWSDMCQMIGDRLGLDLPMLPPYKACDYKPAYGLIFADLLQNFDFWGHIDCDMVLGQLRNFATDERLAHSGYDVLTFRGRRFIHGPLTLYRNTESVNRVFQRVHQWPEIFSDPKVHCFDETSGWWGWWIDHSSVYGDKPKPACMAGSMTDAVREAERESGLRWLDLSACEEWGTQWSFHLYWNQGQLIDTIANKPLAFYHLISAKSDPAFRTPQFNAETAITAFHLTSKGVRLETEDSLFLDILWFYQWTIHQGISLGSRIYKRIIRQISLPFESVSS